MNHETFLEVRARLRKERPRLVDCSELNVYRSLAAAFPAIAPSQHPEAPWRCHVAERYLAQLGLAPELKVRTQVSQGVRHSLRVLFGLLGGRGASIAIPSDVYPVYLQLAAEARVTVEPYAACDGLPALEAVQAVLICDPLKPWGGSLSEGQADRLTRWVREDPSRLVLIDSAYATPPEAQALRLMHEETAMLLVSLSKGWLLPAHVGLCIVPSRWQREAREAFSRTAKDEQRLRIGFSALTEHAARPLEVRAVLQARARALDAITAARPELKCSPCAGYFARADQSFEQLLELGVLGVPASVFGGSGGSSILSSLAPAP